VTLGELSRLTSPLVVAENKTFQATLKQTKTTKEHWIQRITFTTETNATRVQSQLSGQTHTQCDRRMPSDTIPSPLAKQCGKDNKKPQRQKQKNTQKHTV